MSTTPRWHVWCPALGETGPSSTPTGPIEAIDGERAALRWASKRLVIAQFNSRGEFEKETVRALLGGPLDVLVFCMSHPDPLHQTVTVRVEGRVTFEVKS